MSPGCYRTTLDGTLELHGKSRPQRMTAELAMLADSLRLSGERPVGMAVFGMRPVTALGGTIRLKDDVKLTFELAAVPQAS